MTDTTMPARPDLDVMATTLVTELPDFRATSPASALDGGSVADARRRLRDGELVYRDGTGNWRPISDDPDFPPPGTRLTRGGNLVSDADESGETSDGC